MPTYPVEDHDDFIDDDYIHEQQQTYADKVNPNFYKPLLLLVLGKGHYGLE